MSETARLLASANHFAAIATSASRCARPAIPLSSRTPHRTMWVAARVVASATFSNSRIEQGLEWWSHMLERFEATHEPTCPGSRDDSSLRPAGRPRQLGRRAMVYLEFWRRTRSFGKIHTIQSLSSRISASAFELAGCMRYVLAETNKVRRPRPSGKFVSRGAVGYIRE